MMSSEVMMASSARRRWAEDSPPNPLSFFRLASLEEANKFERKEGEPTMSGNDD